jgi:hypothetical protein
MVAKLTAAFSAARRHNNGRASDAECGTAATALRDQLMCDVPVAIAGYWIAVGTGML